MMSNFVVEVRKSVVFFPRSIPEPLLLLLKRDGKQNPQSSEDPSRMDFPSLSLFQKPVLHYTGDDHLPIITIIHYQLLMSIEALAAPAPAPSTHPRECTSRWLRRELRTSSRVGSGNTSMTCDRRRRARVGRSIVVPVLKLLQHARYISCSSCVDDFRALFTDKSHDDKRWKSF